MAARVVLSAAAPATTAAATTAAVVTLGVTLCWHHWYGCALIPCCLMAGGRACTSAHLQVSQVDETGVKLFQLNLDMPEGAPYIMYSRYNII